MDFIKLKEIVYFGCVIGDNDEMSSKAIAMLFVFCRKHPGNGDTISTRNCAPLLGPLTAVTCLRV